MNIPALCRCAILLAVLCTLSACGSSGPSATASAATPLGVKEKTYQDLVVGFAQIGAESEWRTANTRSIQEAASHLGVELKFSDAQQQQENQIKAIRSFIAQRVDVIGVSPVVEDGWDTVFTEVKEAGIPLIVLDRHANVPDNLFSAFIGSDSILRAPLTIGEGSITGAGSVVTRDVPPGKLAVGVPARIRERIVREDERPAE